MIMLPTAYDHVDVLLLVGVNIDVIQLHSTVITVTMITGFTADIQICY